MSGEMDEVIQEFLVESTENLDQFDQDLVALEDHPEEVEIIGSIFRTIHTIKGTCGFLGFTKLEKITHVGESLLSLVRDGKRSMDQEVADALLGMGDAVRAIIGQIEQDETEGDTDYSVLVARLAELQGAPAPEPEAAAPEIEEPVAEAPIPAEVKVAPTVEEEVLELVTEVVAAVDKKAAAEPSPTTQKRPSTADSSIRVDVQLLDKLMNLVGELVLARNQILQFRGHDGDAAFNATTQRLNVLTTELQEGVMKTRMQPIGSLWNKFPRVLRDLSKQVGKEIELYMEGKETELDKSLLEAIKDPLTHLVRNAVDHGIESADRRMAMGKSPVGSLKLRAFHEGGQVNIEISDDGGGIDPAIIRDKALEKGLLNPEQAERLGDRELVNLIFAAGFSTAGAVSNISGRGVGMDVVKTNIEKIGGTVDIQSVLGEGSTIRIKIPLTLAIIPAQIIHCNNQRFAIPQVSLLELLRLEGDEAERGVESIHGTPVYRLRGQLLPLVYLDEELGLAPRREPGEPARVRPILNIVVLQADDRQFGLLVDGIQDSEEIVVKPLGSELQGLETFAGATIMGDGTVALILDVLGIATRAQLVQELHETQRGSNDADIEGESDCQSLLLFGIGSDGRLAMPLHMVARLEEFKLSQVEKAGARQVVQYRGELLPLISIRGALGGYGPPREGLEDSLQVVVHTATNGRSVGFLVDEILDIVEANLDIQCASERTGLLGSAVIQDRVTDLMDAEGLVLSYDPNFYDQVIAEAMGV